MRQLGILRRFRGGILRVSDEKIARSGRAFAERQISDGFVRALTEAHLPEVYGFMNAGKLEGNSEGLELLREWVGAGFSLGNHTYSHRDINTASIPQYIEEIERDEPVLRELSRP